MSEVCSVTPERYAECMSYVRHTRAQRAALRAIVKRARLGKGARGRELAKLAREINDYLVVCEDSERLPMPLAYYRECWKQEREEAQATEGACRILAFPGPTGVSA